MKITALNIGSNAIKYLATNGDGVAEHGSMPPTGLIKNGLILQPDIIADQIKSLFASHALPRHRVICSINGLPFSYRLFALPKMEPAAFHEAIIRAARREMPLSPEEMYLSWQAYPAEKGEWQILVAGIARQPIDNLIKTLSEAGIKPYFLDLQHLSLARLANQKDAIIVDFEKDYSNIVMLVEGVPQGLHIVPSLGPEAVLQDEVRQIAGKLAKMVDFYNGNHPKKPIKESIKVLLTGELTDNAQAVELMRQEVAYPVELLTAADKTLPGLPLHEYAVNAGSLLMNVASEKSADRDAAPYHNFNLGLIALEQKGGKKTLNTVKKLLMPLAIVAGIGILITSFLSRNQAQVNLTQLQAEVTQAKSELAALQDSINRTRTIEDSISEIEATIQQIQSGSEAIFSSRDYVRDIASVVRAMPEGLSFSSMEIDDGRIAVYGNTVGAALVVQFARNLETQSGFSEADIEWIDRSPDSKTGPGLAFMISISR
jgi:Tfp pilus assembly PilM family ATPase